MNAVDVLQIISLLGVAAVSGWLAGILLKGRGFGLIGNIIIGVIGAVIGVFVGGFLAAKFPGVFDFSFSELVKIIIWSTVGSVILLFIIGIFKK